MRRSFNRFINNFVGFLRLFVYANFWVAGAVYALTRVTEILIDAHHHSLAVLNAAGTLVVYGFDNIKGNIYVGLKRGNGVSMAHIEYIYIYTHSGVEI